MIRTLRTKLLIGIAPLLAIMVGLGLGGVVMFYRLGGKIDFILRENYQSVRYAQNMKEALERLDSAFLFAIGGEEQQARDQFREFRPAFEQFLEKERGNVTLPGEQAMVDRLSAHWTRYVTQAGEFLALEPARKPERTKFYFARLLPTFRDIKREADGILDLNQKNMEDENAAARHAAAVSTRLMVIALLLAAGVAGLIAVALSRSLLGPIQSVTHAARAMARGDLEQVVPVVSHDELGELATAFNSMARTIREYNQAGTARLLRAQKTAQATIDSFPDPVVVVDTARSVERANPAARRLLGVTPVNGAIIPWSPTAALGTPLTEVLRGRADHHPTSFEHAICLRDDGQERYFLPRVLAIRDEQDGLLGAAVVLTDVTRFRMLDQLKSDMVSTVSHELKTPLTSIQMVVHLLLEEVVGPLDPKQVELLLAARQDSDRLLAMVNDLLDLTRIEQGRVALDLQPVAAADLIAEAIARFTARAQDDGITLEPASARDLPPVLVDRERIAHVFDNLIGNALAHTDRGGRVRVAAAEAGLAGSASASASAGIRFQVIDNGEGIPAESLPHVFERFFRVQGSRTRQGAGLGLAITREIVAAHDGTIDVESRPAQGTTFTFTLPCAPTSEGASVRGSHLS
jgi:two-component system, NtrC family, sensor histidine kinase KinB